MPSAQPTHPAITEAIQQQSWTFSCKVYSIPEFAFERIVHIDALKIEKLF